MKPKFHSILLACSSLLAISYSHAGQIWDGGSIGYGDNNWNTAANWDGDLLPTFTNAITFTGNLRNGAVNNLTADSTIGGIDLTNDGSSGKTSAFTLSNNRITLGGNINTTGFTPLPGVTNNLGTLSVTWNKGAGYIGAYNTHFVVETSTTLSDPWTVEASPGNVADSPASVKYTFPGGPAYSGKRFARLKVTGP